MSTKNDTTLTQISSDARIADLKAQLTRRREAARRMPPLECGRRDPLRGYAHVR